MIGNFGNELYPGLIQWDDDHACPLEGDTLQVITAITIVKAAPSAACGKPLWPLMRY